MLAGKAENKPQLRGKSRERTRLIIVGRRRSNTRPLIHYPTDGTPPCFAQPSKLRTFLRKVSPCCPAQLSSTTYFCTQDSAVDRCQQSKNPPGQHSPTRFQLVHQLSVRGSKQPSGQLLLSLLIVGDIISAAQCVWGFKTSSGSGRGSGEVGRGREVGRKKGEEGGRVHRQREMFSVCQRK